MADMTFQSATGRVLDVKELRINGEPIAGGGDGGPASVASNTLLRYGYSTEVTEPPASTQLRLNGLHPYTAVTKIWAHYQTTDGLDAFLALKLLPAGATVYVQNRSDHTMYAAFTTTGPTVDKTGYFEIPVTHASHGAALPNNQAVVLART